MNILDGDLIALAKAGRFDVIIHGCNCFCTMGAGIARLIRDEFPHAYQADLKTGMGDKSKLGDYSKTEVETPEGRLTIINGYTQFDFSGKGVLADYHAIQTLFARLKKNFSGARFGYPKIGAGLAGGDWQIISNIIDQELLGEDHTLVRYSV